MLSQARRFEPNKHFHRGPRKMRQKDGCFKEAYTEAEADDLLRGVDSTENWAPRRAKIVRRYKCPQCGFWHVTSKGA